MAELRERLEHASGSSHWVIALELDIRGFSRFSEERESVEAAYYLRRTFIRIIDDYFGFADFIKSTGDGLLLIFEHDEGDLVGRTTQILATSRRLVVDFPDIHETDPMVNFPVPSAVGIGIARGAATRLASNGDTVDYAGRVLNLASRLCDLARPKGIVVSGFDPELAGVEGAGFEQTQVYLRGIADEEVVSIFAIPNWTQISDVHRRRPVPYRWVRPDTTMKLRDLLGGAANQRFELEAEPADSSLIEVTAHYKVGRGSGRHHRSIPVRDFEYALRAGRPGVRVRSRPVADALVAVGVRPSANVTLRVAYPVEHPARDKVE